MASKGSVRGGVIWVEDVAATSTAGSRPCLSRRVRPEELRGSRVCRLEGRAEDRSGVHPRRTRSGTGGVVWTVTTMDSSATAALRCVGILHDDPWERAPDAWSVPPVDPAPEIRYGVPWPPFGWAGLRLRLLRRSRRPTKPDRRPGAASQIRHPLLQSARDFSIKRAPHCAPRW